jgi:probable blue pigment (indigoidine) exporter
VKLYRTALLTVLAPISWGTTYVTITELAPAGRPLLVAALRVLPAALVLLLVGTLWQPWRPHGSDWWRTAALSVCNFSAFFPLLIVAVYRLPGGVAAAAGGLQPLLVAGLSVPLANRRPTAGELAVGAIAAVGVAMVVVRPGADVDPLGVAAAVAANVSFAAGVVLTKRWPSPSQRLAATGWQLLFGGALLVPLAAAIEGAPPGLTATNVAGLGYLTLVATALAFLVWFSGIERLPAPAPPLLGLAAPVTGAVLGWLLLGQSLSPAQLVGFAVTLATIAYAAQSAAEPARPRSASPTDDRRPSHHPIPVGCVADGVVRQPLARRASGSPPFAPRGTCRAACGMTSCGTKAALRSVDTQNEDGAVAGSCPWPRCRLYVPCPVTRLPAQGRWPPRFRTRMSDSPTACFSLRSGCDGWFWAACGQR